MNLQVDVGDFSISYIAPPTSEPLTLAQAKDHLRLPQDLTDFDSKLNLFIPGARAYLEDSFSLRIMKQQVLLTFSQFPRQDRLRLPVWPIQSVDVFKYIGVDGTAYTLNVGATGGAGVQLLSRLNRKPVELVLPFAAVWPAQILTTADGIQISLTCGYMNGKSPETLPLPPSIQQAMCLMLAHWWDNGAAVTVGTLMQSKALALGVDEIMASERLYW